jgi:hypothetical protein
MYRNDHDAVLARAGRGVWRRSALFGGALIEVAALVVALVLAGVLALLDRRR